MIDEALRQHYKRLFSIKPSIDTSKPRHFLPEKRSKKKRASSASVSRRSNLTKNRDFSSNELIRQQDIVGLYSSDNEERDPSFPASRTEPRGALNNSYELINNYGNSMTRPSSNQQAISDRIDQFFSEVSQKEMELQKEYQQKQMRIEARRRPAWNRSISYQSSFESRPSSQKNSSRRPGSLNRDLSHRSSRISDDMHFQRSQRTNPSLETRKRPSTASMVKMSPQLKPTLRPASAKPSINDMKKREGIRKRQSNRRPQSSVRECLRSKLIVV